MDKYNLIWTKMNESLSSEDVSDLAWNFIEKHFDPANWSWDFKKMDKKKVINQIIQDNKMDPISLEDAVQVYDFILKKTNPGK